MDILALLFWRVYCCVFKQRGQDGAERTKTAGATRLKKSF